jgi:hypothetical protein
VCVLVAGEQSDKKDASLALRQAETLDEFERATIEAQENRRQFIRSLIRMLRRNPDKERMIRISYLLGEYRATEAMWDLAKCITLEAEVSDEDKEPPRWGKYPAQEALIKCGVRSVPYMVSNLESSGDEKVRELSAMVVWQVIGGGLPRVIDGKKHGRQILENAIDVQTDLAKKARLESALAYFE